MRMYSFQTEEQPDIPSHWPPELAAQKRPVVHVHEVSDGEEEPPKSRRKQEEGANPAFGAALGRLILGEEVELEEALEEARQARQSMGSNQTEDQCPSLSSQLSRIRAAGVDDHREILGLSQEGDLHLSQVQSSYRQIMRLLHPDKRDASMSVADQKPAMRLWSACSRRFKA